MLDRYERGHSTASELMLGVLTLTDKDEVREALDLLPKPVLKKLQRFVGYYTPDIKVFKGPTPKLETVRFVRASLARRKPRECQ